MTERPLVTRDINKKLDDVIEKVTRIDERLSRQPLIDKEKEKTINLKFEGHEKRICGIEANQKWVVLAILGVVLNAIAQLILK